MVSPSLNLARGAGVFESLAKMLQRPEVGLSERLYALAYQIGGSSSTFRSALELPAALDLYQNLCLSCSEGCSCLAELNGVGMIVPCHTFPVAQTVSNPYGGSPNVSRAWMLDWLWLTSKNQMQYVSSPIHTYCVGQACSMGSLLLAAGEKGKRHALPNSSIMIHRTFFTKYR